MDKGLGIKLSEALNYISMLDIVTKIDLGVQAKIFFLIYNMEKGCIKHSVSFLVLCNVMSHILNIELFIMAENTPGVCFFKVLKLY